MFSFCWALGEEKQLPHVITLQQCFPKTSLASSFGMPNPRVGAELRISGPIYGLICKGLTWVCPIIYPGVQNAHPLFFCLGLLELSHLCFNSRFWNSFLPLFTLYLRFTSPEPYQIIKTYLGNREISGAENTYKIQACWGFSVLFVSCLNPFCSQTLYHSLSTRCLHSLLLL